MHIPDGFLSPAVCLGTGLLAAGTLTVAFRKVRHSLASRTVPLTGMVAALVFAGQMVNFPIGLPVSGHLLGGTLAAVLLGPWGGCVAISLVLFVQMALFSDGGWLSYGANVFNMGIVGTLGGWAIFQAIRCRIPGPRGILLAAMAGAWGSVMAAAAAFGVEFVLSHPADQFNLRLIWVLMASFHSLIGVGEALITGLVLSVVLAHRHRAQVRATGGLPLDHRPGQPIHRAGKYRSRPRNLVEMPGAISPLGMGASALLVSPGGHEFPGPPR